MMFINSLFSSWEGYLTAAKFCWALQCNYFYLHAYLYFIAHCWCNVYNQNDASFRFKKSKWPGFIGKHDLMANVSNLCEKPMGMHHIYPLDAIFSS
jgi:hypothetical protein